MPRRDNKGSIVAFNAFELATPLYGFLGGSIDAASVLAEIEGGFTHDAYTNAITNPTAKAIIAAPITQISQFVFFPTVSCGL